MAFHSNTRIFSNAIRTALLVLPGVFALTAGAEPYEVSQPAPSSVRTRNAISPDNRHLAASVVSVPSGKNLVVARQDSRLSANAWTTVADFSIGSLTNYHHRIKTGKSTTWVAWQGYPLTTGIYVRQVLPTLGPIELVAGSEGQSAGFDLALDDQERPCLVSFSATTANTEGVPFIRVHRRLAQDSWEHTITVYYDGEDSIRRPEAVAIVAKGTKIHLFDLNYAEIFTPSLGTRRYSNLYHTQLDTSTTLAAATYLDYFVVAASTGTTESLQPAITDLSAAIDGGGNPGIAFSLPPLRQVQFSGYSAAGGSQPWDTVTLSQPNGSITGTYSTSTSLTFDATNRPHVAWQSSAAGEVTRSIRTGYTWSRTSQDGLQITQPSFLLDQLGNAHFSGVTSTGAAVAARPLAITDPDGNGFSGVEEAAFAMTGAADPKSHAPASGIVTVNGVRYPSLTYHRPSGGSSTAANPYTHPDFTYLIERSSDLTTWTSATADLVHYETSTGSGSTVSTWRSSLPLDGNPHQFFRMRVGSNP